MKHLPIFPKKTILIVLCAVALIAQLGYDVYVFHWAAPGHYDNNIVLVDDISAAISNLSKPATVEPLSKKVYVPEASLVLPPYSSAVSEVIYNNVSDTNKVLEVDITTKPLLDASLAKLRNAAFYSGGGRIWSQNTNPSRLFQAVPAAQSCSRGVHVVFSKQPDLGTFAAQKTLNDGRTMYLYKDTGPCKSMLNPLVNYLQQAQGY